MLKFSTVLIEFKSCASVGNFERTNFLNVPSDNLIELFEPFILVMVSILFCSLSTEFFKKPKLGMVTLELVPFLVLVRNGYS